MNERLNRRGFIQSAGALFGWGALRSGGLTMEMNTAVPSELGVVIQAVVILFMAIEKHLTSGLTSGGVKG